MNETVILEIQSSAYRLRTKLKEAIDTEERQRKYWQDSQDALNRVKNELKDLADFLQEHSPDTLKDTETWHQTLLS